MKSKISVAVFCLLISSCIEKENNCHDIFTISGLYLHQDTLGYRGYYKATLFNNCYEKITIPLKNEHIFLPYEQTYYQSFLIERFNGGMGQRVEEYVIRRGEKRDFTFGGPSSFEGVEKVRFIFLYKADSQFIFDTLYFKMENGVLLDEIKPVIN